MASSSGLTSSEEEQLFKALQTAGLEHIKESVSEKRYVVEVHIYTGSI